MSKKNRLPEFGLRAFALELEETLKDIEGALCKGCSMPDCPNRAAPFEGPWVVEV